MDHHDEQAHPKVTFSRPRPADVVTNIVESVAEDVKDTTRVLAVLCDNESGVLSRVTGAFQIDAPKYRAVLLMLMSGGVDNGRGLHPSPTC